MKNKLIKGIFILATKLDAGSQLSKLCKWGCW